MAAESPPQHWKPGLAGRRGKSRSLMQLKQNTPHTKDTTQAMVIGTVCGVLYIVGQVCMYYTDVMPLDSVLTE